MKVLWIVLGIVLFVLVAAGLTVCGGLIYLGANSPDTFVVPGKQVSRGNLEIIEELGLLEPGEEIAYFYSDGVLDVREGLYVVTTSHLILYSESWDETLKAPWHEIEAVEADYNESFFHDSWITVILSDGETWVFPLSSERGLDKVVVKFITERIAPHPASVAAGASAFE